MRQKLPAPPSKFRGDPVAFARERLKHEHWAATEATLRALWKHKRVVVRSRRKGSKTFGAADATLAFLEEFQPSRVLTTASGGRQVRDQLWSEIGTSHARARLRGECLSTSLRIAPDHFAIGFSTDDPANVLGWHGTAAHPLLIVIDEGPGVEQQIWDALQGSINGEHVYVLVQGNPLIEEDDAHFFARLFRPDSGYHRIHIGIPREVEEELGIPASTSPVDESFGSMFGIDRAWIEQRAREWGVESPMFYGHVLGRFPLAGSLGFLVVSKALLQSAEARKGTSKQGRHMGVDVSRLGADETVAMLLVDGVPEIVETWRGADLMTTANEIVARAKRWDVTAANVHIDVVGIGGGVVDRMRQMGFAVDAVDFGSSPLLDWAHLLGDFQVKNRRAELHWVARRAMEEGLGHIPERFAECWREAQWARYELRTEGSSGTTMLVEPKDEIKARHGRSPDHFDAFLLAWSRAGNRVPQFFSVRRR